MRRHVVRSLALLLALPSAGCLPLSEVTVGICGNEIVDPGEDCDGVISIAHDARLACGLAGTATACRFDCSKAPEVCPKSYICGSDGVCRQPSGQFEALTSIAAKASLVMMADFDGDTRSDLITLDGDSGQIDVRFFERDGIVTRSFTTPSDGIAPSVGTLDAMRPGPGRDLIYATTGGVGVERGQPDRSFLTTAYPAVRTGLLKGATVAVTDVIPAKPIDPSPGADTSTLKWSGDEMLIFLEKTVLAPAESNNFLAKPVLPLPVKAPAGRILIGNLDEEPTNSPCSEIVLPDAGQVWIVTPCLRPMPGADLTWNTNMMGNLQTTYPPVQLPAGATVTKMQLAQLNPITPSLPIFGRDKHLDLLIEVKVGEAKQVVVAYGLGNGTFRSTPPQMPSDGPDNKAVVYDPASQIGEAPLAVADFNSDGVPDFVAPFGLLQSIPSSGQQKWALVASPVAGMTWSEALILDHNGDGRLDFVAGGKGEPGVQLYTRTSDGKFNPELLATSGPASNFVVGDFDGDLNLDLAFRVGPDGGPASLMAMFGQQGELPTAPKELARLDRIDLVIAGTNLAKRIPENGFSDILVLGSTDSEQRATVFLGRSDRHLEAPYYFVTGVGSVLAPPIVVATATGRFHAATNMQGPTADDLAVLVTSTTPGMMGTDATLWLLSPKGAADLPLPAEVVPQPSPIMPVSRRWGSAVMGPVDLDEDGRQELVILTPDMPADGMMGMQPSTTSTLYVAGAKDDVSGFEVSSQSVTLKVGLWDIRTGHRNPPLCLARVDGDDHVDLVVLGVPEGGTKQRPIIFWGTGKKDQPFEAVATALQLPTGDDPAEEVRGFTCIDLNADGLADIVALTGKIAYSTYDAATAGTRKLALSALIDPRDPQRERALPGGTSVTAGDIDDDYLPDLVISNATSAALYRGKAVIP